MNNSLYGEILHHLQNGADAADIKKLVDEAQEEVTESDKKHLDEVCRNYKEATLAFYKALNIPITEEIVDKNIKLTRKIAESIDEESGEINPHVLLDAFLSIIGN